MGRDWVVCGTRTQAKLVLTAAPCTAGQGDTVGGGGNVESGDHSYWRVVFIVVGDMGRTCSVGEVQRSGVLLNKLRLM